MLSRKKYLKSIPYNKYRKGDFTTLKTLLPTTVSIHHLNPKLNDKGSTAPMNIFKP